MSTCESGFAIDVSRGPNWLFLRLDASKEGADQQLADALWGIVSRHFIYRVVLEFGPQFGQLSPMMIAQLDAFRTRLEAHDGALRVCGLNKKSADNLATYCKESKLKSRLTSHSSLVTAVFGTEESSSSLPAYAHQDEVTQDSEFEALRVH
jgi:hypothetical protein